MLFVVAAHSVPESLRDSPFDDIIRKNALGFVRFAYLRVISVYGFFINALTVRLLLNRSTTEFTASHFNHVRRISCTKHFLFPYPSTIGC